MSSSYSSSAAGAVETTGVEEEGGGNAVPLWERSKENAAPIERGRNVVALEGSLRTTEADKRRIVDRLWEEVNLDRDVLEPWLRLIQYMQSAYPSSNHLELLEECVLHFHTMEPFYNDTRFVKVCCLYASLVGDADDPLHAFDRLHQLGIGATLAIFWVAWAWQAERCGDYSLAQSLLESGMQDYRAQPHAALHQRYQQFLRRQRRREREAAAAQADGADDGMAEGSAVGLRGALGRLTLDGVRRHDRSGVDVTGRSIHHHSGGGGGGISAGWTLTTFSHRVAPPYDGPTTHNHRPPSQQNCPPSTALEIYRESSPGPSSPQQSSFAQYLAARRQQRESGGVEHPDGIEPDRATLRLQPHQERRKENLPEAEEWNRRGGLHGGGPASVVAAATSLYSSASIPIFVDPECALQHQNAESLQRLQRQQQQVWLRGGVGGEPSANRHSNSAAQSKGTNKSKKKEPTAPVLWWDVPGAAFDKRLLLEPESGLEQSLEEARAHARFYVTLPASSYALGEPHPLESAPMDESFDSSMSMTDDTNSKMDPSNVTANSAQRFLDTITPRNASVDSSVNVSSQQVITGAPTPTINTQWALKELSVMFCSSPAVDDATPFQGRNLQQHLPDTSANDSSLEESYREPDSSHPTSRLRDDTPPLPHHHLKRPPPYLHHHDAAQSRPPPARTGPPSTRSDSSRSFSSSSHPGLPRPPAQGGFAIYCDEDTHEGSEVESASNPPSPARSQVAPRVPRGAIAQGFTIYQDDHDDESLRNESPTEQDMDLHKSPVPGAVRVLNPGVVVSNDISSDKSPAISVSAARPTRDDDTFSMTAVQELIGRAPSTERSIDSQGDSDTGCFSVYREFLQPEVEPPCDAVTQEATSEWNDFRHERTNRRHSRLSMTLDGELPAFGDVSCIVPDESDPSTTLALVRSKALNYADHHQTDIRDATQRLHGRSQSDLNVEGNSADLFVILSTQGFVGRCPTIPLPRLLQLSSSAGMNGGSLRLGRSHTTIISELGRGAYGVVALLRAATGDAEALAVKAQKPADCLAWEYEILHRLKERLGSRSGKGRRADDLPMFPVALSYLSLADGALLGMTAGLTKASLSLNLVDLANLYRIRFGQSGVPEILAFYYTARMLRTLEVLHWRGKVLHCDVKPDNWVLVTSRDPNWSDVEASELMLVDFGRAVDLQSAKSDGVPPMEVNLMGKATCEEMMCVAMRQGFPWSFDVDTFGVCASAHVLLFGRHMNVQRRPDDGKWRPVEPLKRYFHSTLWSRIFDTLLNVDEVTGTALDSQPASLRLLRQQIEEHLTTHNAELRAKLQHQATLIPTRRQDLT